MTKLIPALLLAPSLFGAEHLRYEAAPTSPPPSATVTVRLYNYANVKEVPYLRPKRRPPASSTPAES